MTRFVMYYYPLKIKIKSNQGSCVKLSKDSCSTHETVKLYKTSLLMTRKLDQ